MSGMAKRAPLGEARATLLVLCFAALHGHQGWTMATIWLAMSTELRSHATRSARSSSRGHARRGPPSRDRAHDREPDSLPEDLRGLAIPQLIRDHEKARTGATGAHGHESGVRSELDVARDKTRTLLVRVRHTVLASYADPDDPRIAKLGALGVGESPDRGARSARRCCSSTT